MYLVVKTCNKCPVLKKHLPSEYSSVLKTTSCTLPVKWVDTYDEGVRYCEEREWRVIDVNGYEWELGVVSTYDELWNLLSN